MATHSQGKYTKFRSGRNRFTKRQVTKAERCGDVDKHPYFNLYGKSKEAMSK